MRIRHNYTDGTADIQESPIRLFNFKNKNNFEWNMDEGKKSKYASVCGLKYLRALEKENVS